jgi:hypothetical protein
LLALTNNKSRNAGLGARRGSKLLLLVCSIIVSLAVAESIARLVGWGDVVLFVRNDDWGFLMKPSQAVYTYGLPVRINSLGLRGPELQEPKPRNSQRMYYRRLGHEVIDSGECLSACRIKCASRSVHVEAINVSNSMVTQNSQTYVRKTGCTM